MSDRYIFAVSKSRNLVVFNDGMSAPIIEYLDGFGEECEPEDAVAFIAGSDEVGWFNDLFEDYDRPMTIH